MTTEAMDGMERQPTTADNFAVELERCSDVAAGLRRGSIHALVEYFQLGGGQR